MGIGERAIVPFRAVDNALNERPVLLEAQAGVYVNEWALAGDRLVIADSENLPVYEFT